MDIVQKEVDVLVENVGHHSNIRLHALRGNLVGTSQALLHSCRVHLFFFFSNKSGNKDQPKEKKKTDSWVVGTPEEMSAEGDGLALFVLLDQSFAVEHNLAHKSLKVLLLEDARGLECVCEQLDQTELLLGV